MARRYYRNDEDVRNARRVLSFLESTYNKVHAFLLRHWDIVDEKEEKILQDMEENLLNLIRRSKPHFPKPEPYEEKNAD